MEVVAAMVYGPSPKSYAHRSKMHTQGCVMRTEVERAQFVLVEGNVRRQGLTEHVHEEAA